MLINHIIYAAHGPEHLLLCHRKKPSKNFDFTYKFFKDVKKVDVNGKSAKWSF